MDENKRRAASKLATQALDYVRKGLSREYIDAKLIESRGTLIGIDDINVIIDKCIRYKRPDFSLSLCQQSKFIIFSNHDELMRFNKQYWEELRHVGCICSYDNLTMTI